MSDPVDYYRENVDYATFLETQSTSFFEKYVDSLAAVGPGKRVLDIGCGTGQALRGLVSRGLDATGLEVSKPNAERVVAAGYSCAVFDGARTPFDDEAFDAVGAFNVLEHVNEPEAFILEAVRNLKPGGRLTLSSPNFLRVVGFRDYHYRMRGIRQKFYNALRLRAKLVSIRRKEALRFDRMDPVVKTPFEPDDDAIVVTNLLEMKESVQRAGLRVIRAHCTDRYAPGVLEWALNATPFKYVMLNAFLVAEKPSASAIYNGRSTRNS